MQQTRFRESLVAVKPLSLLAVPIRSLVGMSLVFKVSSLFCLSLVSLEDLLMGFWTLFLCPYFRGFALPVPSAYVSFYHHRWTVSALSWQLFFHWSLAKIFVWEDPSLIRWATAFLPFEQGSFTALLPSYHVNCTHCSKSFTATVFCSSSTTIRISAFRNCSSYLNMRVRSQSP